MNQSNNNLADAIKAIKNAILKSRYRAALLVNREQLSLYYGIGKYISENSRQNFWGTNALETISDKLQNELTGLRGFSVSNLKNMRSFYEAWKDHFIDYKRAINRQPLAGDFNAPPIGSNRQPVTGEIDVEELILSQPKTKCLQDAKISFLSIGFTHHCEILAKSTTDSIEEKIFYIECCSKEFWSKSKLKYNLKSDLFHRQGKLPNNFKTTISDADLRQKAVLAFKDEYLLDFINIESPDDEPDERNLEQGIVSSIKNFIMSLGKDFSFIGNQHRLIVDEQEYFIDLLFFNRQLQCLVAIELKRGEFKPEYLGKMNFYLSALDDMVRLPHENRSIGIILCKSQKKNIVEYAFRDMSKPMGVATFKTDLPDMYKNILPDAETLRKLM